MHHAVLVVLRSSAHSCNFNKMLTIFTSLKHCSLLTKLYDTKVGVRGFQKLEVSFL